jgi:hypothetical protein
MPGFSSEAALIDEVQQRLVRKFSHVPKDQISTTVAHAHARFEHSRVRDFIPLLVERRARAELARALAVAEAPAP